MRVDPGVVVELFSSAFCAPCRSARAVLARAGALMPGLQVQEVDVAADVERARAAAVTSTPTLLVRDAAGAEVFRAAGVPTLPQLLVALDRAGLTPGS